MRRRVIAVCLTSICCRVCAILENRAVAQSPAKVRVSGVGHSGGLGTASTPVPAEPYSIPDARLVRAQAVPTGLAIIPTFDSSITMSPNAQAIETSINDAIGVLEALYSDSVTVQIDFQYSTTVPGGQPAALGNSLSGQYSFSYAAYIRALKAHSRTTNDAIAVDNLPASPLATNVDLTTALGRALGLNTPGFLDSNGATDTGGTFDGIVVLNPSLPFQFNRAGGISPGNYDAQRVLEHEMDEILGLASILPATTDGGESVIEPEDLFRYSSPGITSLTPSSSATSYFSINGGVSNIVGFNQQSGLDYGDWLSPSCAAEAITPLVQYAIICPGTAADVSATSPEGIALDVIGYTLRAATSTYTISGTVSGAGGNGATVTLTGAATATAIANSSGAYSFSGLTDGSYTVTPSLSGYIFEPPSQPVTVSGGNQTANFTAFAAGTATHLAVITHPAAAAGVPIQFTVTALDANNNTVTGFTDSVAFTSTDASASLPGNMTLTNGVGVFPATFATIGSQTITATDSLNSAITGTSAPISVVACTNEGANWNPSATTISSGNVCFQAGTSITANSGFVVNGTANVTFVAGSSITLGPGFDAKGTAGATFTAYVP